jgi:ceramide glucosyltransferase
MVFVNIWCFESRRCHGSKLKISAMIAPILALATFCIIATVVHIASIAIAIFRLRRNSLGDEPRQELPPVSLVRPLCGLDNYAADTLGSTFDLDYPHYEILFCVATENDPVVPLVDTLIAEHEGANARLLIGATAAIQNSTMWSRAGARRAMIGSYSPTATC